MERIRPLEGRIQHYAWGSRTVLAELQGRPAPTPEPEAELWFGAHPLAPSRILADEGWVPLSEWLAADPEGRLGPGVARRFGGELPFLLKVLAVARPLSLQAHPDATQARAGFAREERAGIPREAPERCYRDPRPKPELLCALGPFAALKGFRPLPQIAERLAAAGLGALLPGFEAFRARPAPETWRAAFAALLGLEPAEARRALGAAVEAAKGASGGDPSLAWLPRLAAAFPGDPAALAPLFLHYLVLEPGQALFLPAGELHCYLEGVALEVMGSSDNVLRGGLTEKHVDVGELLRVLRFEAAEAAAREAERVSEAAAVYAAPAAEFELAAICVELGTAHAGGGGGVEVLLATEGGCALREAEGGALLPLRRGTSALVPAGSAGYRIEGKGTVYRVSVPRPAAGGVLRAAR